jgi:hypothetical protein
MPPGLHAKVRSSNSSSSSSTQLQAYFALCPVAECHKRDKAGPNTPGDQQPLLLGSVGGGKSLSANSTTCWLKHALLHHPLNQSTAMSHLVKSAGICCTYVSACLPALISSFPPSFLGHPRSV